MNEGKWTRRDHRVSWRNLSAYLDGELAPRLMQRIERHIVVCDECRQALEGLRATKRVLRATPAVGVPRSFVLPRTVAAEQKSSGFWNSGFVALRGAAVAISLMLALVLSGNALLANGVWQPAAKGQAAEPGLTMGNAAPEEADSESGALAWAPTLAPTLTPYSPRTAAAAQEGPDAPLAMAASQDTQDDAAAIEAPQHDELPATPRDDADQHKGLLAALAAEPRPESQMTAEVEAEMGMGGGFGATAAEVPKEDVAAAAAQPTPEPTATDDAPGVVVAPSVTPESTVVPPAESLEQVDDIEGLVAEPTMTPAIPSPTLEPVVMAAPEEVSGDHSGTDSAPLVEASVAPTDDSRAEVVQRSLRLATGILAGLLLMVAGSMLWAGHMRSR